MVVFHGQELRGPIFEPLSASGRLALGTMAIAAGVISGSAMTTSVTFLNVTTQLRGAAASHIPEDTPLVRGDHISIALQEVGDKLPEDLGDFEPRLDHGAGSSFEGDAGVGLSAAPAEGPGLGLSPGSSRQSSGLRVAVTFAIDT